MSYSEWQDKVRDFRVIDVRKARGNFFPGLKKQATGVPVGKGITVVQAFEPYPLYSAMESLGFERHTEKASEHEYRVHFYRTADLTGDSDKSPFKPIALLNYPLIDEGLGEVAVNFWEVTWNSDKRALSFEMRLLLSLTNAVGAGRMRQASRELIKAYACGVETPVFDDVFELIAWNQGIGFFSSEVGPSVLFKAYKFIKMKEQAGVEREKIVAKLMEQFGEKNPEVGVE